MEKQYRLGLLILGLVIMSLVTINAVQANTIVQGTPRQIGQGIVRSYVAMSHRGQVSAIGVILSESALSGLPLEMTEVDLALPRHADRTPFTHIGLNWNPQGHPPIAIYGTPHFDLHFCTISQAARQRITAAGADAQRAYRTPETRLIPAGYILLLIVLYQARDRIGLIPNLLSFRVSRMDLTTPLSMVFTTVG